MPAPPSPAPPSPFEWGRTERIQQLLGGAFDLKFERGTSFYREPSAEAAWDTFSTGYGPTKALAVEPRRRTAGGVRTRLHRVSRWLSDRLGICVPRDYWLTVGRRR